MLSQVLLQSCVHSFFAAARATLLLTRPVTPLLLHTPATTHAHAPVFPPVISTDLAALLA